MQFRLFLPLILVLFIVSPSFALAPGSLGDPPVLDATVSRDGEEVVITGTVTDENVDTVRVTVKIDGMPFEIPIFVENGVFDVSIPVPFYADRLTLEATDEEGLKDTSTHNF